MEFSTEETPEDGSPRRKSIGTPWSPYRDAGDGGSSSKTRRYSVGIPSSHKGIGEESDILPKYLRASTGSCHDFCKYGRKHEQLKPRSPIMPKRPAIVNKEKISKTVATKLKPFPDAKSHAHAESIVSKGNSWTSRKVTENELKIPQKRSTSYVKPKPMIVNSSSTPDASAGSSGGRKKKDNKTVKKMGATPQEAAVKKVMVKATPSGSVSPEPSVSGVVSLKARKCRIFKPVSPLKDQNWMPKTELKQPIANNVQEIILHVGEEESEDRHETLEMEFVSPNVEIVQSPPSLLTELIIPQVFESSGSSSHKEVLEEEPTITPPIFKSSHYSSENKVLEGEFEYADDEQVRSSCEEFSEEESEYTDNEEAFVSEHDDEIKTSEGNHNKNPRKGRMVVSEGKDTEVVKLKFMRGKILDLQSENNGARRLKFRRLRVMDGNEHRQTIARRIYKKKDIDEATNDSNNGSGTGSIVLKHQVVEGKKDGQGLFNNVIEETASKLVESRKSKVKALVGAFETVISLQDVKPPSS